MSGNPHDLHRALQEGDRRQRRTREALLSAFGGLILGRRHRYAKIKVDDIVSSADVGRSTFYEHYKSKDDVLIASMAGMLDVLAGAVTETPDEQHIECVLAHFVEMRSFAREVLWDQGAQHVGPRIARDLARRVEVHLRERLAARGGAPVITLDLLAMQIAESQLALVRAWLFGRSEATPQSIASAMCSGAQAMARAHLP
jgi:AcrR family transcriptional regulator